MDVKESVDEYFDFIGFRLYIFYIFDYMQSRHKCQAEDVESQEGNLVVRISILNSDLKVDQKKKKKKKKAYYQFCVFVLPPPPKKKNKARLRLVNVRMAAAVRLKYRLSAASQSLNVLTDMLP